MGNITLRFKDQGKRVNSSFLSFEEGIVDTKLFRFPLDSYVGTETYRSKYLIICTGLHCIPQVPTIPGMEEFKNLPGKTVKHSSEHKTRGSLKGKKVMILGTGETGMDLAYESIKAGAKEVFLCSRGG